MKSQWFLNFKSPVQIHIGSMFKDHCFGKKKILTGSGNDQRRNSECVVVVVCV